MFGAMATLLLPDACPQTMQGCLDFRDKIYEKYLIEVPIMEFQGSAVIRVSANLYSKQGDIDSLKAAMRAEFKLLQMN